MVQQASAGAAEPLYLRPITPFSASCQTKKEVLMQEMEMVKCRLSRKEMKLKAWKETKMSFKFVRTFQGRIPGWWSQVLQPASTAANPIWKLLVCLIFTFKTRDDENVSKHIASSLQRIPKLGETESSVTYLQHVQHCFRKKRLVSFSGSSRLETDAVRFSHSRPIRMLAVFLIEQRTRTAGFNNLGR